MQRIAGKKVLFIITKSNWGGAQEYVYTLATRFQEVGAEVAVALGGTGERKAAAGELDKRLKAAQVRTIFIESFMWKMGFLQEFRAFFEILRAVHRERPDVLHVNSSKAGGMGSLAGRLLGVSRIVFTAHGWAHREEVPLAARSFRWVLSWLTVLFAHCVIVVSKEDAQAAPVWFSHRKIHVVHNGISTFPLTVRSEARGEILSRAPAAEAFPFWYVAVGELNPNKGFATLMRAFSEVAADEPRTALVIIGEGRGGIRRELEALAGSLPHGERIFFAGFIQNARQLLAAADVFVLSSIKEGLPYVILEAGMAQLPVVATRVGAIPEIIEDEVSGLLVPKGSQASLSRALSRMKTEEAFRTRAGLALRAKIVREFSEEAMLKNTISAYM